MANRPGLRFLPLLLVAACASSSPTIDRLWSDLQAEARDAAPLAEPGSDAVARTAERAKGARRVAEAGDLRSGRDHLRAAVLLAESTSPADWPLAAELGRKAAELGEPRGLRVVAEAIDKDLVSQRRPQRYGTQFEWDAEKKLWRLAPIDAATTDVERASMGVPKYADLIAAEARMNASAPAVR